MPCLTAQQTQQHYLSHTWLNKLMSQWLKCKYIIKAEFRDFHKHWYQQLWKQFPYVLWILSRFTSPTFFTVSLSRFEKLPSPTHSLHHSVLLLSPLPHLSWYWLSWFLLWFSVSLELREGCAGIWPGNGGGGACTLTHGAWWMRGVSGCWERRVALICHWREG